MNFKAKIFINIALALLLFSCEKYIGYGVVMLPEEDSSIEAGSMIKITKESRIRETWVYNTEEEEHIEIKKWRVEYFEDLEDAQNYINEFNEYKDYYVIVNQNAHSMRIKPTAEANLVYRLKKDQRVKVIGRTDEKEKIARFEGYWWHLITDDGVTGWSYDSYLSVYNDDELVHSNVTDDGPEIHEFFRNVWRPIYFWEMQKERNIDLEKFKDKFKMVPDLDNKEITISMPDHYVSYNFTDFKKIGEYTYILEGTPVQLDFSYKGQVSVIYSMDSKSYETDFVYMKDSVVAEIIETEETNRKLKYSDFMFDGPVYTSKAYGKVTFQEDNNFIWDDKSNLITKQLLTSNADSQGTVNFNYFLGEKLKAKYDGVITFDFGDRQELTFLYNLEDDGVRFLYVPETKIENKIVENDNFFSPIQLYFTGSM